MLYACAHVLDREGVGKQVHINIDRDDFVLHSKSDLKIKFVRKFRKKQRFGLLML